MEEPEVRASPPLAESHVPVAMGNDHKQRYHDDITNKRWGSLKHAETIDKTDLSFLGLDKKVNHNPSEQVPVTIMGNGNNQGYLEDIANKKWGSLRHAETIDKTDLSYLGLKDGRYNQKKVNHKLLLREIRGGMRLKPCKTVEKNRVSIPRGYKVKLDKMQRKKFLDQIVAFPKKNSLNHYSPPIGHHQSIDNDVNLSKDQAKSKRSFIDGLRSGIKQVLGYPQVKLNHDKQYLNDIANGRWKSLKHVHTVDKTRLSNETLKELKCLQIKPVNRRLLLREIRGGIKLRHVETVDKCKVIIPKDFKITMIDDKQKQLLTAIRDFKKRNTLIPTTISDKSQPYINGVKVKKFVRPSMFHSLRYSGSAIGAH
eukprot:TRINITY_DN676_c0_g3_i2.p1 TRINITY_DN676_c0_g3~~TRINITY_DN676_c0_g3_i2.p1  ORF type:complete len:369 (-),score=62.90 TRINITY_DN676_c0_g3_i2:95-1201(-)